MKAIYEARGWSKFTEEDSYKDGCNPKTSTMFDGKDVFQGDTVEEVVQACLDFLGCMKEDAELDSCGEDGRLDVQRMENADADTASKAELAAFKKGKARLWLATYTFYIEKVQKEAVSLKG